MNSQYTTSSNTEQWTSARQAGKKFEILWLVIFLFLSTGCEPSITTIETITHTPTVNPTPSPTITVTPTSTLTPTPTPSPTTTPSPTQTQTPTLTPTPLGGAGALAFRAYSPDEKFTETFKAEFGSPEVSSMLSDGYSLQGISPDGTLMLVAKGKTLSVMALTGEISAVMSDGYRYSAYWLPEINKIAYIADKGKVGQIFLGEPDGSSPIILTDNKTGVLEIIPSFDGQGLYWEEGYTTQRGIYHTGTYWTSLDGTETRRIKEADAISPDGSKIAYMPYLQEVPIIKIIDRSGNNNNQVDLRKMITLDKNYFLTPISGIWWAPDSSRFLVELTLCNQSCDKTKYYLLDYTGQLLQELPDLPKAYEMSWSPDSNNFVFGKNESIVSFNFSTNEAMAWNIELPRNLTILDVMWLRKPTLTFR
jgi:hypothetical protein